MKTKLKVLAAVAFLSAGLAPAAQSTGNVQKLKSFTPTDPTIAKDLVVTNGEWFANCKSAQTISLFEVPDPAVENCIVIYRVKLKTEDLAKPAYLEMWCRFPGKGEFFSRDLEHTVTGSNGWASYETPFFLKKGERPDLIKLNLVLKGPGKVWIKDVELLKGPLPSKS